MSLVCPNCKTVFVDVGGDPNAYLCNVCGYTPLYRTPVPINTDAGLGLLAGVALGAAIGGGPGAVIGGLIGIFLGAHKHRPEHQ